jgi:hypothetical protein
MTSEGSTADAIEFLPPRHDWSVNRRYYRVSTCGRYSVAAVYVFGVVSYEAWLRGRSEVVRNHSEVVSPFVPPQRLGAYKSAARAERRCIRHAVNEHTKESQRAGYQELDHMAHARR